MLEQGRSFDVPGLKLHGLGMEDQGKNRGYREESSRVVVMMMDMCPRG